MFKVNQNNSILTFVPILMKIMLILFYLYSRGMLRCKKIPPNSVNILMFHKFDEDMARMK